MPNVIAPMRALLELRSEEDDRAAADVKQRELSAAHNEAIKVMASAMGKYGSYPMPGGWSASATFTPGESGPGKPRFYFQIGDQYHYKKRYFETYWKVEMFSRSAENKRETQRLWDLYGRTLESLVVPRLKKFGKVSVKKVKDHYVIWAKIGWDKIDDYIKAMPAIAKIVGKNTALMADKMQAEGVSMDIHGMYQLLGEGEKALKGFDPLKFLMTHRQEHEKKMKTDPAYRKEVQDREAAEKAKKAEMEKQYAAQVKAEKEAAKKAYAQLKKALAKVALPTKSGKKRTASPNEFMLMVPKPIEGYWQFKHAASRNYVFVNVKTGVMAVPQTKKPFMLGTFDEGISTRMYELLNG